MLNAFTVDVEDYYQVSAFERDIDRADWHRFESRVEANTRRMLALLQRHGVKATFFVLGWVAQRQPRLVEEIAAAGHEIGSHGYWHRLIYRMTPEEFRTDLVQARRVLQEILGRPVEAFRAPSFSITKASRWAQPILVEEGVRYDSSIFPIHHDRYGIPDAPLGIHRIDTPAGSLWEFPMSVVRWAGWNLPVSGGGYFRLYPVGLTRRLLARVNRPFVFYVHPWEIDPGQPRLQAGSRAGRWRHRVHLATTEKKLEVLLRSFRFGPISDAIHATRDAG